MTGLGEIFRRKCRELAVGEGGSALALTLAFLLPVYLFALAIYGVSETIHRKIELQNAADAAAYSAAIVQADYLSRIAVLNKAVAWSYADMTCRQLDYGMAWFTLQTIKFFNEDFMEAKKKNASTCHMHTIGVNWSAGTTPKPLKKVMKLTLRAGMGLGIPRVLEHFNERRTVQRAVEYLAAKYGAQTAKRKGFSRNLIEIQKHSLVMGKCARALTKYIVRGEMKKAIEKAANDILDLNTREIGDEVLRYVRVGDPKRYITPLRNTEEDERRLLQHALTFDKDEDYDQSRFFGKGIGFWYKRTGSGPWIKRGYHQRGKNDKKKYGKYLHAEWSYFWTKWKHIQIGPASIHRPPLFKRRYALVNRVYDATDKRYQGFKEGYGLGVLTVPAVAYTLNEPVSGSGATLGTLFGKEGTIVVGLARKNTNPLRIFGTRGLVTSFDQTCCGSSRPDYIWALSAARAAYNAREADSSKRDSVEAKLRNPEYHIDFKKPGKRKNLWNLREADWDAMFVPVREADSRTMKGFFASAKSNVLKDVMTKKSAWKKKNGKKWVSANADWSKIGAPAGFDGSGSLKWNDLNSYLCH